MLIAGVASVSGAIGLYAMYNRQINYSVALQYSKTRHRADPVNRPWFNLIIDGIHLGALPLNELNSLDYIRYHNITDIICLVEEFELTKSLLHDPINREQYEENNIAFHHYPTPDYNAVPPNMITDICQQILQLQQQGRNVLVHCKAGKGRSAMIVAAYLVMVQHQPNPLAAINFISEIRNINLNDAQWQALVDWFVDI